MEKTEIAVIGGGASGLAAALAAARCGARVVVLERLDRVGKKLLATGNGRCNLTNTHLSPARYRTSSPQALAALLQGMPVDTILRFFEGAGLLCREQEQGRVYPYCNQASMVLDVLRLGLERHGARVECQAEVEAARAGGGAFCLELAGGRRLGARRLILAAGGVAAPKLGSAGGGPRLAQGFGHSLTPLYPCLVPIRAGGGLLGGLKGIRAYCRAGLYAGERCLGEEMGEILFTDYGLSGIPALQLSCHLGEGAGARVRLDFFPGWERGAVRRLVAGRRGEEPSQPLERFLLGTLNKRVLYAIYKSLGLWPLSRPVGGLSEGEEEALALALKGWRIPVAGTLPFEQAQVTRGGVRLEEVEPASCQSRLHAGLYLTGEVLDAAGECGGYNLHWAFGTGLRAGEAAAKSLLS